MNSAANLQRDLRFVVHILFQSNLERALGDLQEGMVEAAQTHVWLKSVDSNVL